jgi:four helix bundle protein
LGIVEQELDESLLWMELLVESDIISIARMQDLMTEADELIRITVKAIQSTKKSQS